MEKTETTETTQAAAPAAKIPAPKKDLLAANAKATATLSSTLDPKLRDAAAKAAKVKPELIIGVRETETAYSVVVATATGVEKLEAPKKGA